jgi:DNA mismatch repair protein MutL
MAKIQVLPPHEALKIAAGEVIDRPAHVVKELVENAIDAGSTSITIHISKAGKELIRIIDNGCGMELEDARLCFLPHATSKISTIDDLEHITSFGFRGEALASIAAISKVTLVTKSHTAAIDDVGVSLEYSQAAVVRETPIACQNGTDIQIRDLFFNIPVRKKFLKQDETEWNAIQSVVHAFCFSNLNIHFKLFHNDTLALNAPPVVCAKDRALQLWDHGFAQTLIPLATDVQSLEGSLLPGLRIHGYISHHNAWRYGRQYLYFFVNNRWIKNAELAKGVLKGYLNVLPPDRFPAVILFITVDQSFVDINVHPKKEEIKFSKPLAIQNIIMLLVKKTLEDHLTATLASASEQPVAVAPSADLSLDFTNFIASPSQPLPQSATIFRHSVFSHTPVLHQQPVLIDRQEGVQPAVNDVKIIGQLFNTYIVFEKEDAVIIIDQHAAHERILYEKFKKNFDNQTGTTLLFPEFVSLSPEQIAGLMVHKDFFARQGITLDILSDQGVVIRSAPPHVRAASIKELVTEIALFIQENDGLDVLVLTTKINEFLHAQMSCKAAIKAGDVLTVEQMKKLITDLQVVDNRFICVHGRPTTWTIAKIDIEKKFKRI